MKDHAISLVKESFDLIEPIAEQAGVLFYANLFEIDPSLERLFKGDIAVQAEHLMQTLGLAVARLDQPEALAPVLLALGRRHVGYGVRGEHDGAVLAALLKTLYQSLGVAYNEEVEAAWIEVYGEIAATMKASSTATA